MARSADAGRDAAPRGPASVVDSCLQDSAARTSGGRGPGREVGGHPTPDISGAARHLDGGVEGAVDAHYARLAGQTHRARRDDLGAGAAEAEHEYGISLIAKPKPGSYDGIVVAVAHKQFVELGASGIRSFGSPNTVIFDIKHVLPKEASNGRL